MAKQYKEVSKPSSIGSTFEPDLVNKLNKYCSLTETNRTKFISDLIESELKGKILTNDFIELEKPFYFNLKELLEKGTVEATTEKPSSDLYNQIIIKKVPNNLDSFEEDLKTFCFDNNSKLHKGIITFNYKDLVYYDKEVGYNEETEEVKTIKLNKYVIKTVNLVFDYSFSVPDINKLIGFEKDTLKISSITSNELPVLLDNDSNSAVVLKELEKVKDGITKDFLYKMLSNCFLWKYNNTDVLNYFHLEKNPYHVYNILGAVFTSSAKYIDEVLKLLDNLVYKTVELYVENRTLSYKLDSNVTEKDISEVFKEAVIELNFYEEVNKFSSDNEEAEKVYNVFCQINDNEYLQLYHQLVVYVDRILKVNEESNIYSLITAFPYDNVLFEQYSNIRYYE